MGGKKTILLGIVAAIIALVAAAIFLNAQKKQWVSVAQKPLIEAVYGLGTVTSEHIYHLKLGVASHVKHLYVQEGERVLAGQKLVAFTDTVVPRAPFTGTITSLPVHVGETVPAQENILTLVDLTKRYLLVSLEQQAALKVRVGQKVKANFESLDEKSFSGVVQAIYPNNNNFYVKIGIPDLPQQVLPDMTADVAIIISEQANATFVPSQAIHDGKIVIKTAEGIQKVTVETGLIQQGQTQIRSPELTSHTQVQM